MIQIARMNLKKYLLAGILLAFGLFMRVTPALAEENNATAVDTSNTSTQAAEVAPAAVNPDSAPAPTATTQESTTPAATTNPNSAPIAENAQAPEQNAAATTEVPVPLPQACGASGTDSVQGDNQSNFKGPYSHKSSVDNTTNNTLNNCLDSNATSGNAGVTDNGNGGNATTGDAQAIANIINMLSSTTGLSGGALLTFVQNIYGDQVGDITIDPSLLSQVQSALCGCNVNVNNTTNNTINNNINMGSTSGNATVSNNGTGGNATTGDATTLLNLVNIINSIISSGKTFIGTINIYGNLDGDILLPPDLIQSLLNGSGAPPGGGGSGGHGHHSVNITDNMNINNNINVGATSGNATVEDNDEGGNATTGDASTQVTIYNFAGKNVVAKDALLVFINVLGKWIGLILNAPQGATSTMLGSGVESNTGCGCLGGNLNSTTNSTINNNINLNATSGNALVSGNGVGGNATSGNATSTLNLINILNSNFSLSGWFGILIINVFGTWNGSFGIDTAAGTIPVVPGAGGTSGTGSGAGSVGGSNTTTVAVFGFKPKQVAGGGGSTTQNNGPGGFQGWGGGGGGGPVAPELLNPSAGFNPLTALGCISACFLIGSTITTRKRAKKHATNIPVTFP